MVNIDSLKGLKIGARLGCRLGQGTQHNFPLLPFSSFSLLMSFYLKKQRADVPELFGYKYLIS